MFARRRKTKQFCEARFVRLAGWTIAVGLNPFGMLDAQSIVYLSLKLPVRTDLLRNAGRCVRFHHAKDQRRSNCRHLAYAGFCSTTYEVMLTPSFEIAPKLWRRLNENCL